MPSHSMFHLLELELRVRVEAGVGLTDPSQLGDVGRVKTVVLTLNSHEVNEAAVLERVDEVVPEVMPASLVTQLHGCSHASPYIFVPIHSLQDVRRVFRYGQGGEGGRGEGVRSAITGMSNIQRRFFVADGAAFGEQCYDAILTSQMA